MSNTGRSNGNQTSTDDANAKIGDKPSEPMTDPESNALGPATWGVSMPDDKDDATENPLFDKHAQDRLEKKKRGKRQRSKRNRKQPRSEIHSNDDVKIESTIARLEMNGKPILETGGYEQFIRIIHPYAYTFSTFAKRRWIGRTLLDVYQSEFGSYPESYYDKAIKQGRIMVCDKEVRTDYQIKDSDVLTHTVHRHEPAVAVSTAANQPKNAESSACNSPRKLVKIVAETDEVIALDKPGTLPIHPCGGYHKNALLGLLEEDEETKSQSFYTIHRLDRLTSGLVVLAKSPDVAKHLSRCIRQRNCQKFYLARVKGRFPLELEGRVDRLESQPLDGEWPDVVNKESENSVDKARRKNARGFWITDSSGSIRNDVSVSDCAKAENTDVVARLEYFSRASDNTSESDKSRQMFWLHLACPTRIVKPKNGVCEAGTFQELSEDEYLKTVKPAETSFGVVSYDPNSDSTLIICRPITGRTHQIRLHAKHVGHPIANDPNYGGNIWYGNEEGRGICAQARAVLGARDDAIDDGDSCESEMNDKNISDVPATVEEVNLADSSRREDEPLGDYIKRVCVWCGRLGDRSVVEHSMLEFLIRSRGIWLHALQYCIEDDEKEGPDKYLTFRTDLPPWALCF